MKKILIIGGAGFIGANSAERFSQRSWSVCIFDNLSRNGSESNVAELKNKYNVAFVEGDIRNYEVLKAALVDYDPDVVLHLAGQTAVTSSVKNPREDFEINAVGTFNVLEALRSENKSPFLIFSSTNKVYGNFNVENIVENDTRYIYKDLEQGVDELAQLDFHSPYGCSKGAADQYVRDYARIYGIPSVVMRQSCVYGPRQFGIEDQGWVAWFIIAIVKNYPITIYGNGKQVRDVLYVDDLVDAYEAVINHRDETSGKIYNIGGGPQFTFSLLEFLGYLRTLSGKAIETTRADWRPGDQKVYISNIEKASSDFLWRPIIDPKTGVRKLYEWVQKNEHLFQ
jgi:CDP-paratose 2-epimerase